MLDPGDLSPGLGADSRPLGVLGGTFDPIHYAHLRLAEEACERLSLAGVRLIPAGAPPHRSAPRSTPQQRLDMVTLAARSRAGFDVDASEVMASGPSYTVLTLARLRAEVGPHRPLVLLLGADAFLGLATWHEWRRLFDLAHIAVATRPNYILEADQMAAELAAEFRQRRAIMASVLANRPAGNVITFGITPLDISSTAIRAQLKSGASPRFLLPDPVLDYIGNHHLYQ
ncbi:MAG: nicotinate-nucleotide adenylyltransferase [Zoogloea sp.]|uniref:nicotinate-nucleotide adenylyltransferase n=1 Tax=Zoogloea sp. TaxID=49181 RepID=UPI003F3D8E9E